MDFTQSSVKLPVANFDVLVEQDEKKKRYGDSLPCSIRAVISGPWDNLYGLKQRTKDGYQLGNIFIKFEKDNLIVNNKSYPRTSGLFELIVYKNPQITPLLIQHYTDKFLSKLVCIQKEIFPAWN